MLDDVNARLFEEAKNLNVEITANQSNSEGEK